MLDASPLKLHFMEKKLDIKKILFLFYVIIPTLFYGIPFIFSLALGPLRMYFFGIHNLDVMFWFSVTLGHFLLGFGIYKSLSKTNYLIQYREKSTLFSDFAIPILFFIYIFIPLGYFATIINTLFLIIISRNRIKPLMFVVLFLMALFKLIFVYDRYPVIMVCLIYYLPMLSKLNYRQLFERGLIGVFVLVYVLQPLKGGNIPFTGGFASFFYVIKHMYPIYIGAFASFQSDFSTIQLIGESLPLVKGALGQNSSIEIIAKEVLDPDAYSRGTRLGSNSAIYFRNLGGILIIISLIGCLKIIVRKINNPYFYNVILFLFLLEGPYFIRHSYGQTNIRILIALITMLVYITVVKIRNSKMNYGKQTS